jgi:hypothetical protein
MSITKQYDYIGAISAFEDGELDEAGTIELFQYLVDTGLAWKLQGAYGRQAAAFLNAGLVRTRIYKSNGEELL